MMETISSEMLRGHVDTIILLTILEEDKHTNQIKEEIESRVEGQFTLKQGTFYSCLQRIVNQGYVTEYRSTSSDGKRRKYYKITEKGKVFIHENKDKWISSRSVIDNLIQVPSKPFVENAQQQSNIFENNTQIDNNQPEISAQNEEIDFGEKIIKQATDIETKNQILDEVAAAYNTPEKIDDIIEDAPVKKKSNLQAFEEFFLKQSAEFKEETEQQSSSTSFDDLKSVATADDESSIKINNSFNAELYEKMQSRLNEKNDVEKTIEKENAVSQANNQQNSNAVPISMFDLPELKSDKNPEEVNVKEVVTADKKPSKNEDEISKNLHNYVSEPDDFYDGDEPISHNYKSVLNRIFPKQKPAVSVEKVVIKEEEQPVANPIENQPQKQQHQIRKGLFDRLSFNEVTDTSNKKREVNNVEKKNENQQNRQDDEKIVFSDIYALAEREGFKVRTSSTTLKNDIGKIYINRLIFHSALTFYAFVLIEILLLTLTTRTVANIDVKIYLILAAICAILPLGTFLNFIIDPKRKVANVLPFKSVIEFSFIIMLNLIVIVFFIAIIKNIDFTNTRELLIYIFYPLIAILNIPIYFFIKYLKLDNQKYFS